MEEGFPRETVVRAIAERRPLIHAAALATFGAASAAALMAHGHELPRTAAVVYLLGVTLVGAMEGFWGGLIAALLASLVYNFFMSDPVFRFSFATAEEYIPLIAFNLSAAASGLLAGSLRDRALAAENANRSILRLFSVSQKLQGAVRVSDIPDALAHFCGGDERPEIYLAMGNDLVAAQSAPNHLRLAEQLFGGRERTIRDGEHLAFLLSTPTEAIGVLVLPRGKEKERRSGRHELEALVNLATMAVERCLLLDRVSEAELIKRSEEFKTALLSSVSHDMRTPLSAIAASASGLASFGGELPEEARRDLLATIQEQCDRLNRYTGNLLNMGRLQAGLDATQFTECDAIDVLGSAIAHVRRFAPAHSFAKVYRLESALVQADPAMLEQLFYNVLENAVRYGPADQPVRVVASAEATRLAVSIEDCGPGIADPDRTRVFERFYRSRAARSQDGSGLGLSIAKGFAEAFGGTIEVAVPEAQRGTAIRITLPLLRRQDDAA